MKTLGPLTVGISPHSPTTRHHINVYLFETLKVDLLKSILVVHFRYTLIFNMVTYLNDPG